MLGLSSPFSFFLSYRTKKFNRWCKFLKIGLFMKAVGIARVKREACLESKLPALGSGGSCGALDRLSKYELSGGQIDNIVRKVTMAEILTGNVASLETLAELCSQEKLEGKVEQRKIGFRV